MHRSCYKSEGGKRTIQDAYRAIIESAFHGIREAEVPTSRGRTHVIEAGPRSGEALLLLHGTSSNAASWAADIPVWARRYRVIAPDLPGEPGLSDEGRLTLASDEMWTWLSSLLSALEVDKVRIVGMSLGGWAALDFATRFPQRVEALALIAPSGLAPQRMSFIFKALPLLLLGNWGLERVNRMVYYRTAVPEEVNAFGRLVAKHFRPVTEPVPVFDEARLSRLSMPVLYLGGDQDALLRSEESAARLSRCAAQAQVQVLEETGHVILGQSERVLAFLEESRTPLPPQ